MALIKCKECDNDVSTTAKACPKCGAKISKKAGKGVWIAALLVIFLFTLLTHRRTPRESESSTHSVTYIVEGSTDYASLAYTNDQGGLLQEKVSIPWQKSFAKQSGEILSITAANLRGEGNLTVRIVVDGKEIRRTESIGGGSMASTSYDCC